MRKTLPLNGLRAFEAAARHMSFQKAADELCVTATAVSHQIRQLEHQLGVSLFKRRPRPLTLTDAGVNLFPAVRDALDDLDQAVRSVRPPGTRTRLTVSMTNAFASYWLLPRLGRFQAQHPDIAIDIHATESVTELRAGEVDCAIRYLAQAPRDLVCEPLFRDRFLPVCAPRLGAAHAPMSDLHTLCKHTLLHFEWQQAGGRHPSWRRWFADLRQQQDIADDCESQNAMWFSAETLAIQAALQGQGIALCSTLMTATLIKQEQLVVAYDFGIPGYLSALVYPPTASNRQTIEAFRAWVKAEADAFMAELPAKFFAAE